MGWLLQERLVGGLPVQEVQKHVVEEVVAVAEKVVAKAEKVAVLAEKVNSMAEKVVAMAYHVVAMRILAAAADDAAQTGPTAADSHTFAAAVADAAVADAAAAAAPVAAADAGGRITAVALELRPRTYTAATCSCHSASCLLRTLSRLAHSRSQGTAHYPALFSASSLVFLRFPARNAELLYLVTARRAALSAR